MSEDALAALRAKAKPPQHTVRDRKDRADATLAPDAKKARDIVKAIAGRDQPGAVPLHEVASQIARVTGDPVVRELLESRVDSFRKAVAIFMREELRAPEQDITWLGDRTGALPERDLSRAPEHKILLGAAWGALLRVVNEATKVGIQKRSKYAPITLIADVDATPLSPVVPEWN